VENGKTILIISATPIEREPRVIRQYNSLKKAGFRVIVAGYMENNKSKIFNRDTISLRTSLGTQNPTMKQIFLNLKSEKNVITRFILMITIFKRILSRIKRIIHFKIYRYYFKLPNAFRSKILDRAVLNYFINKDYISGINSQNLIGKLKALGIAQLEAVISHDYLISNAGKEISNVFKAKHIIDFHEHPLSQYSYRQNWNQEQKLIQAIIAKVILEANKLIFVSEGIRNLMSKEFNIPKEKTLVIRSLPNYETILKSNKVDDSISIIYLGNINPFRGLETAIMMMRYLPHYYNLNLQGYGSKTYIEELKALSRSEEVGERVNFVEPVPFSEIVQSIKKYDIGYFVCENFGPQREFALPNKLFTYIMSELCVVSSNFKEIGKLLRMYNCGLVVDVFEPFEIAKVISEIPRDQLRILQNNSATAKLDLCWEREENKFLQIFN
jgi:glycosyltransferase involved in cell wall biosynthesis